MNSFKYIFFREQEFVLLICYEIPIFVEKTKELRC